MIQFDHEWLVFMRDLFPKGTQLQCSSTEDHIPALSGETGTIEHIDDLGLLHCSLEDGSTLVSAIDEGCFQINLWGQEETPEKKNHLALKDKNKNLPECSESHCEQRMAILNAINLERLPEWAAEVLFPPLRSILVLPGKAGQPMEVSTMRRSICRQLNADRLNCEGNCSEKESFNLYFDADAQKKGLPFNRCLDGQNYYGPILITGMHAEDRSLTDQEMLRLLQRLNAPAAFREKNIVPEINKDTFWELIAQAKEHPDGPSEWLLERLVDMGPEQAKKFDDIINAYMALADQYGLWTAASVMECGGCTDDGFIDFRGWLIAQGREVYMAALKDPDSLADVQVYPDYHFDGFQYIGAVAYEKLTGREISENFDVGRYHALKAELKKEIVYGEGIGYPYTWSETAAYLPRLCAAYMAPEELAWRIKYHNDTWNLTSPDIQSARATAQKSKKIRKDRGDSR